jgi:DNA-binding MarR family transcriptional regulator
MTESKPISDLDQHLGYWLRYVSNHVSHAFTMKVESHGVTVAEWVIMREMLRLGPINPSQLAVTLGMTRGAISKLIERLIAKAFVERKYAEDDRRYQSVALTATGKKLVPKLAKLADQNELEFFGHLTPAQFELLKAQLQEIVRQHGWKDVPVS